MVYHNDILLSLKWKIAIDFSWGSSGKNNNEKKYKIKNEKKYINTYIHIHTYKSLGGKKKERLEF
jgi:hypothetical protein